VTESVADGGLVMLRAMRDRLASAFDACESPRDLPALSRELDRIDARIAGLTVVPAEGDGVDEVADRRAARRERAAKGSARARTGS
jgi:hypothetical protein